METRYLADGVRYATMTAAELRDTFLVTSLFTPGELRLVYCEADSAVIGSTVPVGQPVAISAAEELRAAFFCQRRELGILNIGGSGTVRVDGTSYAVAPLDGLYVGRASREVIFASDEPGNRPSSTWRATRPMPASPRPQPGAPRPPRCSWAHSRSATVARSTSTFIPTESRAAE